MDWAEVINHPSLQDLPFKIETNEYGEIIMNPVKIGHSIYQGEISSLMKTMRPEGIAMVECAIRTSKGTKVMNTEMNKSLCRIPIGTTCWSEVRSRSSTELQISRITGFNTRMTAKYSNTA